MTNRLKASSIALALFLTCAAARDLCGQAMAGNLVGTVTDPSGGAVANASVELRNVATDTKTTANTDSQGVYRFTNQLVGRYSLTVTASGFTTQTLQNVQVIANQTSTANVNLQVGQVATQVEVREAAALIDTTTANVQTTYDREQAQNLPFTGAGQLGVINLSLLSPGVTSSGGAGYGTGPSVGGQRPTNNNFMVEGVDNNDRSVTGPVVNISNEMVQQFIVQQNQFAPEFGQSSGGQFNTVLRSGTNDFHGSLFEYFQNRNLNAIDESFARQQGNDRFNPRFDQNRIGGTVGGPVVRNKLFFFGGFEYIPQGFGTSSPSALYAPTQAGLTQLAGIPGLSSRNLQFFRTYVPVPASAAPGVTTTVRGQEIPLGVLNVTAPDFQNDYNWVATSDYNVTDRDQLRFRYANTRIDTIDTSADLPQFFQPRPLRNQLASVTYLRTFSPNVTNELRGAFLRYTDDIPAGDFSFPGLDAFPNVGFADLGMQIGPNQNAPQGSRSNTFQLVDNLNWVLGRHNLKFGYDGRKLNITSFFVQRNRGDYQYDSFERFLLDITPEFAERSVGGFPFIGNLLSHYAYVNDEWRVRQNLTLNLGVRYEYVGVPEGSRQQVLNAVASVPGVLDFREPKAEKKNFAPRIGLAWSPGASGNTSIRAGFGMAYDVVYQNLGTNSLPPQFFTTIDAHVDQADQPNFLARGGITGEARPVSNPADARALTSSYVPDQQRPYSINWNFGVQHVLANDYTVEVRYLGTRGIHLPYQIQMNRRALVTPENALPTFLQRPSQAELNAMRTLNSIPTVSNSVLPEFANAGFRTTITSFEPRGNSTYHGLATQLTRRFSRGLTFAGSYTWSHNIDDSTAALFSTVTTPRRPQDFQNLRAERASSALDRRHRFTLNWVWQTWWMQQNSNWVLKNLIGNWMLSGSYIAETGAWATPRSGIDSNRNGDNAGDRTIINPNGTPGTGSGVTALTNSAGAIVGYLATDPTAQYIVAGDGALATAGRNTLRLPGINNWTMAAAKRFNITESVLFEFRGEAYNVFNHPQYTPGFPGIANPSLTLATPSVTNMLIPRSPTFNRPDLAFSSNSRVLQLVARFQF